MKSVNLIAITMGWTIFSISPFLFSIDQKQTIREKKEQISKANSQKNEDEPITYAEQSAIQESNQQFERMQPYGTPVGEEGPIPMDYDVDDSQSYEDYL